MGSDFLKGLGIGLLIAGLTGYWPIVPFVGSIIGANSKWIYLIVGIVSVIMGFRD